MQPNSWTDMRRVLAIRLDNIGDIVLLSPALRTLRQAMPQAAVTLMASPAGSQVAPLLPWIDDLLTYRAVWQDAAGTLPLDPARERQLVEELRARQFDAAFIFTSFSQSPYPPAYACYLAGIPIRIGQSQEFGGSLLTQWVRPQPHDLHQAERNLHLLEAVGLELADRALELHLPDETQAAAERLLREAGIEPQEPFILLAPGASCQARRYDPARFAAVASELAARQQLPIIVAGSERERETLAPVLEQTRGRAVRSLLGRTSLPELAGIIRRASLVLANNSGPLHIADAFRRPIVVLYSGTEYESQWRPRRAPSVLLRRPTSCSPCYSFRCPYQLECLDIPAEEVVSAALDLLRTTAAAATLAQQSEPERQAGRTETSAPGIAM